MEEIYQDLSMVKHAANLAKQEILECVADQALGWLWIAFKKIHSDDLSKGACKCLNQLVLDSSTLHLSFLLTQLRVGSTVEPLLTDTSLLWTVHVVPERQKSI